MQTQWGAEGADAPGRSAPQQPPLPPTTTRRLEAALDGQDWADAIRVIEREWGSLVLWDRALLDWALRELPADDLLAHPVVIAVREIRLRVGGDLGDPDLAVFESILPADPAQLEELVEEHSARFVLSGAAAFMIAFRLHGRWAEALRFAELCEAAARLALRDDPADTASRVPSAYAQIGLTRFQGDDPVGAYLSLREAYDTREQSNDPIVSHDASANLALLLATEGEVRRADDWLTRYRERPLPADPLDGIAMTASLAAALIELERAPGSSSDREQLFDGARANALGWADALTYVRAISAMHRGDPHHALRVLQLDERRTRRHLSSPFFQSRINALRSDVLMVLGHGTLARQALRGAQRSSPTMASLARLHLLAGEDRKALAAARTVINHIPAVTRPHLDATITAALVHQRLGDREQAADLLTRAVSALERCGAFSVGDLHPRQELVSLLSQRECGVVEERWRERLRAARVLAPSIELIHLTEAEQRVLAFLARGRTRTQIASMLFLSPNTVKTQVRSLYTKLEVDSSAAAVRRGRWLGFLPGDADDAQAPS